jgi:hypothetical protein
MNPHKGKFHMKNWFFFTFLIVFFILDIYAHPGRLDRNGGHNGPNGYHYHRGGSYNATVDKNNEIIESDKDSYDEVLRILNTENPVLLIRNIENDLLMNLNFYVVKGPTALEINDRMVFNYLVNTEFDRRDVDKERFWGILQRKQEYLENDISEKIGVAVKTRQLRFIQQFVALEKGGEYE